MCLASFTQCVFAFIQLVAGVRISFLFLVFRCAPIPVCLVHSPVDGHWGCFHLLAVANRLLPRRSPAVHLCEYRLQFLRVCTWLWAWNYCRYGNSMLNFLMDRHTFPPRLNHFTFLPAACEGSSFSTSSPTRYFLFLLINV